MEHSAIDIRTAGELIKCIQGNGLKALVRLPKNEEVVIKQVLDAGADGLVIPMVKSLEEFKKSVEWSHYPPKGKRGVGLSRAQGYGNSFEGYKKWLTNDLTLIAQIEHIESVNNLQEILTHPDLDGIIIGPYDLSGSMGKPGRYNDTDVISVINKIEDLCRESNVLLGTHIIEPNSDLVIEKRNKGYDLIAFSIDFLFLGEIARNEMQKVKAS